jgi:hypothetical protein
VAGLSLCLLVVVGLLAWVVTDDDPYVAPAPSPAPVEQSVQPALATETLARFRQAVVDDDEDAARALAPEGDTDTADALAGIVRNAQLLEVDDFALRYVDAEDSLSRSDDSWSAAVDATWEFHGFDRAPARAEILVQLQNDGDRVALTGFGGGDRVSPLWLSGPLQIRRTARTLVMVDGTAAAADGYARHATAAVPVVRRVLPHWRRGLVVEVPSSVDALDRTLDADQGTYDQIAAVTTAADGSLAPDAPVHVFVNPDVFANLRSTGAQVVMSHEATHVATDAWVSQLPLWLLEGFADYVALRDVDLPLATSASQIIAEVRHDGPPRALPGAAEFNTQTKDLGATYESAWLACRQLALDGGEHALVAFYRNVDRGRDLGAALRTSFGLSVAGFTEQWRTLLSDLAG